MLGHLDVCHRLQASGWAFLPEAPGQRLRVQALVDGQPLATAEARLMRADLAAAGVGDGGHAFLLTLPPTLHDGLPHTLQVYGCVGDERVELQGSPLAFTSPPAEAIRGSLHILNDGLVSGWAFNVLDPTAKLAITITVNGESFAPTMADYFRPDLHALGFGDGCHGFHMAVPLSVVGSSTLQVSAVDSQTGATIPPGVITADVGPTYWGRLIEWQRSEAVDRTALRAVVDRLAPGDQHQFSLVMPVFNAGLTDLAAALDSVQAQTYPRWQLCIADDASTHEGVRALLQQRSAVDARISVAYRADNGHISAASNTALGLATGHYMVLLDHDDLLHPDALLHLAAATAEQPDLGLLFSDEDKCDEEGSRYGPHFKRGWNPDLMLSQNLVSHLGAYRTDLVRQVGGFRLGVEGSQDYDLALRVRRLLSPGQIKHLPKVLYHWRAVVGSTARANSEKVYAGVAFRKALRDDLRSRGEHGRVRQVMRGMFARFKPAMPAGVPPIAVVLGPWRAGAGQTHQAAQAVRAAGLEDLRLYLGVPVDEVDLPTQRGKRSARWALRHGAGMFGVRTGLPPASRGAWRHLLTADPAEVVVWLGDGVRPRKGCPGWLRELVSQTLRPGVGVVGAKVLDEAECIVSFGRDDLADRPPHLEGLPLGDPGPSGSAILCRTVSGVSGQAFAVRRGVIEAWAEGAGSPNDHNLAHDDWAQSLCDQAQAMGLRCLVTPFAQVTAISHKLNGC